MSQWMARHWIGGTWVEGNNGTFPSINPANGTVLGQAVHGGAEEVRAAIEAARDAFENTPWAHSPRLRAAVLLDFARRLEADAAPLAALLTVENGKVKRECAGEVEGAVSELQYYAGMARIMSGRIVEPMPGVTSLLTREAAGVVGIIVPWNAPLILLVRSLAPAMAAGCTAVIKAAPQVALFMARVMEHLAAVEKLPRGAVNMVLEQGNAASEEIVRSDEVDVVSYTGSTAVGKIIMAAAAPTLKRLSLELGGKAPCVVCADANLSRAVPEILAAGTILTGQQCTAATRILVERSRVEEFSASIKAQINAFKVGPGEDAASQMGALIDVQNRDRILGLIESIADSHKVVVKGAAVAGLDKNGAFVSPTVVSVDDPSDPIVQNEHFGPIMTLEVFDSDSDAVRLANATRFGLGASVWSSDLARAQRIAKKIRAGTVWINAHNKLFAEAETGGYRQSGFGRLHGVEGLNDFLETKHVYQDIGTL
jgi:betaine-aldehyde dehydrogenase